MTMHAKTHTIGRICSTRDPSVTLFHWARTSAELLAALWQLPAFFTACSPTAEPLQTPLRTQIYIFPSENANAGALDVFFFNEDSLQRLDAYQRFPSGTALPLAGLSCSGAKKIVALSNYADDPYQWSDIQSYATLADRPFRLEDDSPETPLLFGEASVEDGTTRTCALTMHPMLCRVRIRSLACDFGDRPYAGESLKEVRAYLTHVSSLCHPMRTGEPPSAWINPGRLDSVAVESLSHPEMLLGPIAPEVDGRRIFPETALYGYPNPAESPSFGQPVTTLVIEGILRGRRYYYPIPLGAMESGTGIDIDLTLTRAGSPDPDTPVGSDTFSLHLETAPWENRGETIIHYE